MKFSRILIMLAGLVGMVAPCFAMSMSQPEKLGTFSLNQMGGGFYINASYNKGNVYPKNKKGTSYEKGVAIYGRGEDALYFYYNYSPTKINIGGKSADNIAFSTSSSEALLSGTVYRIETDEKITMYVIQDAFSVSCRYIVLGRQRNGKFVKYFDTKETITQFYGNGKLGKGFVTCRFGDAGLKVIGNKIIISCIDSFNEVELCKFDFTWDDKAQWFGINRIYS